MGALLGELEGGGSFAGEPVGYERKAPEKHISLHGGSLGNLEWAHLPGTLRDG